MAYYKPEELENVRKGLEWAKKNPTDPKSIEIQNRLKNGQLNFELRALGLKEVPIQVPKIVMPTVPQQEGLMTKNQPNAMQEAGGDLLQTAQNIGTTISEGAQNVQDIAGNKDINFAQKSMGVLGSLLGTGAKTIGDVTMGAGKLALSQDAEDQLKSFVQEKAQGIAETETAKKVVDWYANLTPENKLIVDSAGGFASLVAEVVGGGTASKVATPIKEASIATAKQVPKALETGVTTVAKGVDVVKDATRASRIAKQEAKVNEAVGRIIQGKPEDIPQAKKALTELDTEGVRTYADMNERVDDTIEALSKKQDAELGQYTEKYTTGTLGKYTKVGDKTVVQNPVSEALDGIENAYRLSGEAPKAEKIVQLRQKLETEGLTVQEINKIAKEYGIEYKQRSFDKMGNPKAGYNAESFENIRKGVKDVVRERLPDDKSKAIDESISNMYALRDLTGNMETKVQKLYQKIKNRTLAQKVGGAVADVVDLASFGTLRGFIQKLLPSNVGLKTANSLDLEKELSNNLAQIDKLIAIQDEKKFTEAVAKYLKETQPGLSTRVSSNLTNDQKDALLGKLNAIQSSDVMKKTGGVQGDELDLELFDRLEELKKTANSRSLTEREYAELNVLMDEMEQGAKQSIAPSFKESEIPKTKGSDLSVSIRKAKAEGKTFEEWAKEQLDPMMEYKTLDTINDPYIARGTVKSAIDDIGGIENVKRGNAPITKLETTENINTSSERYKSVEAEVKSGKITPIIADQYLRVLDGHHRLEVYRSMGMETIPVIVPKETVGVKFITRSQLKAEWDSVK